MAGKENLDDDLSGNPSTDWTPEKMRFFSERKLNFVMAHDRGGVYDGWARAELSRRENKALMESIQAAGKAATAIPTGDTTKTANFAYDVFLSFGTDDLRAAEEIQKQLEAKGLRVFFSPKSLQSGDDWSEVIRLALVRSAELCIVVSRSSLNREWVTTEWGAGWVLERRMTPILIDCSIADLPGRLRALQGIPISKIDNYVEQASARSKLRHNTREAESADGKSGGLSQAASNRRIYRLAVAILRNSTIEKFYVTKSGAHSSLPGYLWSQHEPNWYKICQRIGSFSPQKGEFIANIEPEQFSGEVEDATTRKILEWYLWAAENNPDFEDIRKRCDLPDVSLVTKAIEG